MQKRTSSRATKAKSELSLCNNKKYFQSEVLPNLSKGFQWNGVYEFQKDFAVVKQFRDLLVKGF